MERAGAGSLRRPHREPALDPGPPTPDHPRRPAAEEVTALLERLEAHRDHPATLRLHDALYDLSRALEDDRTPGDLAAARAALARVTDGDHPLRDDVRMLLDLPPPPAGRDLLALLATVPGLPAREDPVEALALHLRAQADRIAALERSRRELSEVAERQARLLSLSVGAAVVLLLLMALGWALAPAWLTPPPIPAEATDESARGGPRRVKSDAER